MLELCSKKVILGVIGVAIIVAIAVTLAVVLTGGGEDENNIDTVCATSKFYNKNRNSLTREIPPHFVKDLRKIGPPPVRINGTRAATPILSTLTQRVDHFNITDDRTWSMRYLINDEFYKSGGPMFIFLGGEWEITIGYLMTGQMYDLAKEHSGIMFYTEHRYYGDSMPTENLCTENLKYLSADQALADIVYFVDYQREQKPTLENSKVVVVGGSYSATLATWGRMKYPHVINAALASSAPLLAIADFYQYYEVVNENLKLSSEECVGTIKEAIQAIEEELKTEDGIEKISSSFRTCTTLIAEEPHRSYFFSSLTGVFAGLVQYAQPGDIAAECNKLLNYLGTSYEKFLQYVNDYYSGYCLGDYDDFLTYIDSPIPDGITRQWYYQTCTEYGFYQTTSSDNQSFGKNTVSLDLYKQICKDLFEVDEAMLNNAITRTNILYGALEPSVTKVVSVHGTVDPWHSIGALQDISSEAPVIVVEGTSHCADLGSVSNTDSEEMTAAKNRVKSLISEWIK